MTSRFRWIGQSPDGDTVSLRRFEGEFAQLSSVSLEGRKTCQGAVLDLETSGMLPRADEILEIGFRLFEYDPSEGRILKVGERYDARQEPEQPVSAFITQLTGLTDDMLRGQRIHWDEVDRLLDPVDLIIAHNARFDRPFVDLKSRVSPRKLWGCSASQIDWNEKGFGTSKLQLLSVFHGFYTDSHRALRDAEATLHLLTFEDEKGTPYFRELLKTTKKKRIRMIASQSPYDSKDVLKARGYHWNNNERSWQKMLDAESKESEVAWLERRVYQGDFRGRVVTLSMEDQFKL